MASELQKIDSQETLHLALSELAVDAKDGRVRWTRSQVQHYLRNRWRAAAEHYFDGERFKDPDRLPAAPISLSAPALRDALAKCGELVDPHGGGRAPVGEDLPGLPTAAELLARPEPSGSGAVAQMLRALREEIRLVGAQRPKRFRLRDGKCTDAVEGRFVYHFHWSSEPDPHVPGELELARKLYAARVGDTGPGETLSFGLTVEEWLGPRIESAIFRVDPTFLLRTVYHRLETLDATSDVVLSWAREIALPPTRAVGTKRLVGPWLAPLNDRQRMAVEISATARRSYIWGPPGTGKTTSIGALARALVQQSKRVLILSPYNVAVDEATLSVARAPGGPIGVLRVGRANVDVQHLGLDLESRLESEAATNGLLDATRELLAAARAKRVGERISLPSTVRGCLDELGALVVARGRGPSDEETAVLTSTIRSLRARFTAPTDTLIRDAPVVACTLALSLVRDAIHARRFDHLIVDEASVVRTPEAVLAAAMANVPVTFLGDPKQLPPIVEGAGATIEQWLARSPFSLAGIDSPADAVGTCVMLDRQHRMAPPIRAIVSTLFYSGSLSDGEHAPTDGRVLVIDTGESGARSTPKMIRLRNSKENLLHRQVVADVLRVIGRRDVRARALVLSPFVAQKRAYRLERGAAESMRRTPRFETIHSSQGTEQDVVVLDLVLAGDGVGRRSRMLDERKNPHLANLLNVGVSRTKRMLVLVGDLALVRREYRGALLQQLVDRASAAGTVVCVQRKLEGLRASLEAALA